MSSVLKIDQVGRPAGVAGKSRTDGLATGALVTLTDTSASSTTRFRLLWVGLNDTTAVSSLAVTGAPKVWTFSPTAARFGSYLVELIGDEGLPSEFRERRVFGVRLPVSGLLMPALNERGDPTASLVNAGADVIEAADNNADDFSQAALNTLRYAAWWRAMQQLMLVVEAGGGGGVSSVFGRSGVVVAALHDYDASQVDNDSTVPGATVKDALENLALETNETLRKTLRWADDFDFNGRNTTVAANSTAVIDTSRGNWALNSITGGAAITAVEIPGEVNAPGILQLQTSANINTIGTFYRGQMQGGAPFNVFVGTIAANQLFRVQWIIRLSSIATYGFRLFMADSFDPTTAPNAMSFLFDTSVGVNVQTSTRAGGVGTTKTGTPPVAGSFERYTIQQTVIGTIEFYRNGVLVATHIPGENVPGAAPLSFGIQFFNRAASARNLDIDFLALESQSLAGLPPSPAIQANVDYAVREDANVYNVGKASWMYPTIHAAIAAINARVPLPSALDPVMIQVWPGFYASTTAYLLPAGVAVHGPNDIGALLSNGVSDMFSLQGNNTGLESLYLLGDPGAAFARIRCNNRTAFYSRYMTAGGNCAYLVQVGATWTVLSFNEVLIDAQQTTGYVIHLENTGSSARLLDCWSRNCFWDAFHMQVAGAGNSGIVRCIDCSDVRFSSTEIRGTDCTGIRHIKVGAGTPSIRVDHCSIQAKSGGFVSGRGILTDAATDINIYQTEAAMKDVVGTGAACVIGGTQTTRNSNLV